jgi:hypothetical protein
MNSSLNMTHDEQIPTNDEQIPTNDEQIKTNDEQIKTNDEEIIDPNIKQKTPFTYQYKCAMCHKLCTEDFYLNTLTRTHCSLCIKNMAVDAEIRGRGFCVIL